MSNETDNDLELYRKHRPRAFKHVIGQDDAVRTLQTMVQANRVPHALLFTGPSGVAKTTLARIIARKLDCHESCLAEVNAADFRGIDMVRDIRTRMSLSPINGKVRVWIIDEAHKLSNDAQNALLKMLEDTPKHVFFMLATTEPGKLLKTIITRCTEIRLRELSEAALKQLVNDIAQKEGMKLSEEVVDKIVECSFGSGRMALVLLNKLIGCEEDQMLDTIEKGVANKAAIDLCRVLLKGAQWKEVAALIKTIEEEPETVRRIVLAYMTNVLLGSGSPRAKFLIQCFQFNYFDTGKAGLVLSCHDACAKR